MAVTTRFLTLLATFSILAALCLAQIPCDAACKCLSKRVQVLSSYALIADNLSISWCNWTGPFHVVMNTMTDTTRYAIACKSNDWSRLDRISLPLWSSHNASTTRICHDIVLHVVALYEIAVIWCIPVGHLIDDFLQPPNTFSSPFLHRWRILSCRIGMGCWWLSQKVRRKIHFRGMFFIHWIAGNV